MLAADFEAVWLAAEREKVFRGLAVLVKISTRLFNQLSVADVLLQQCETISRSVQTI